jgi:hypothetical protein
VKPWDPDGGVRGIDEAKMGMGAANLATRIFRQCSLSNSVVSACDALWHSLGAIALRSVPLLKFLCLPLRRLIHSLSLQADLAFQVQ